MKQAADAGTTNASALVTAIENYDHFPRLEKHLETAGSSMENVLKCNV